MSSPFHDWGQLRDETEHLRLDFIRTDLGVCLTLATIVEGEFNMGNREHAERTLAEAEKGYSDMLRLFARARRVTPEVKKGTAIEVQASS